jgi:hypothetical protein
MYHPLPPGFTQFPLSEKTELNHFYSIDSVECTQGFSQLFHTPEIELSNSNSPFIHHFTTLAAEVKQKVMKR